MKRFTTLALLAGIIGMLSQCAPKVHKSMESASTSSAAKVAELNKKYSSDEMMEGKSIMEAKCIKCHALKTVETRTVGQWDPILDKMIPKAHLDDTQAGKVRAYILTHAKLG